MTVSPSLTDRPGTAPLVSVLVAAYKADRYLELAVRDAAAQTYPAVEVVVSDDAAADATRAVVEAAGGGRVAYRANPVRLGAAGNHWAALRAARGAWVAILNHDDRWHPTFLERLVAAAAAVPDAVLGFCDHEVIGPDGEPRPGRADALAAHYGRAALAPGWQPSLPALVLRQTVPLAMGAVFRRDAVDADALPADAGPAYDLWLTYLLARSGGAAVYVPDRLTSWREHPQNLTSAAGRDWVAGGAACWAAMAADPAFAAVRGETRRRAAQAHIALAVHCLKAGDRRGARGAARAAIGFRPADPKAAAALALSLLPTAVARRCL